MKKVALTSVFIIAASLGAAAELTREAKVEKILELTNARAMQDQVMAQMKQMAAQQMSGKMPEDQRARSAEFQNRMFDLIGARMNWDRIRPAMVKIWAETFNDQELDGMLAFYESPAGRGMMQKMPQVMIKTMQQFQGMMAELQPEIEKMMKENAPKQ